VLLAVEYAAPTREPLIAVASAVAQLPQGVDRAAELCGELVLAEEGLAKDFDRHAADSTRSV
jgi:hypothetical protein